MSNALSVLGQMLSSSGPAGSQATAPTSQASDGPVLQSLAAVGVCTLAVWIIRRLMYPRKFTLANTPGRHNTVSPLHLLPLFVLWYAVQAAVVNLPRIPLAPRSFERRTLAMLAGQAFMIMASLAVAAATFRHGLRRGFGLSMRHWIYDSWRGVIGYLVVFPVCWGVFYLTVSLLPVAPQAHEMLRAARELQGVWRLLVILSAVLLAPLAEEMFFRGLLQSMLRRYVGPWG
ncbi:MAG TPA: CPBP family intramembrane glutamic endopeptidase, partial [Phycisphaerae bacterium]|nr:CPBP family intramembrane glutamic endopeptidase [Phycisphaerae bacterium]